MAEAAPTLALAIPAFRAARFLPRLLRSAHAQTIPFDDILVYDDCSPDDTGTVAATHGARVIRGDVNRGCSAGKNRLAEETACTWIHFHDADDELKPDFVERARPWMREDGPDAVLFAYEYRDDATGELLLVRRFDDEALRIDPVGYTIREQINPFCGVYRRSTFLKLGGYDTDPLVLFNEDVAFHARFARRGATLRADPHVTVVNWRVGGSMSAANRLRCLQAQYHVMRKAADESGGTHAADIAGRLWEIATQCAAHQDWATADAALGLAQRLHRGIPAGVRPPFRWLCRLGAGRAFRLRERWIRAVKPHLRAS